MTTQNARRRQPAGEPASLQVLSRGLAILGQFTHRDPALSLAELGRRTGLHRATVYRFVKTLEVEGFLTLDRDTGLYRVGPAWAMALYWLGGKSVLFEILTDDLQALAETTGEQASLSVRRGDLVQMMEVAPSSSSFVPLPPVSPFAPLSEHAMVHPRVHLAYAGDETRKRMTAVPAVRYTDHTVTDAASIEARLAETAAEGITFSRGEFRRGAAGMAVPVFAQDEIVAAVGLVIPVERFDDGRERCSRELRLAAAAMGRRLDEGAGPRDAGATG